MTQGILCVGGKVNFDAVACIRNFIFTRGSGTNSFNYCYRSCNAGAATTTIFADLFDKDAVFASKAVMVSTILSVITAPVIVALL